MRSTNNAIPANECVYFSPCSAVVGFLFFFKGEKKKKVWIKLVSSLVLSTAMPLFMQSLIGLSLPETPEGDAEIRLPCHPPASLTVKYRGKRSINFETFRRMKQNRFTCQ